MNERDYMIMEAMVISTGIFVTITIVLFLWLYPIPLTEGSIIAVSFPAFTTFFFGLYFHMKRRIMVLENERILHTMKRDEK